MLFDKFIVTQNHRQLFYSWILGSFWPKGRKNAISSHGHRTLRQCILSIKQHILELYLWKFMCLSIFIYFFLEFHDLAKFWKWLKTLMDQEKSIIWTYNMSFSFYIAWFQNLTKRFWFAFQRDLSFKMQQTRHLYFLGSLIIMNFWKSPNQT